MSEVSAIGVSQSSKTAKQESVCKAQAKFLQLVSMGVDEKDAFRAAVVSVNDKYNPKEDEFNNTNEFLCCEKMSLGAVTPEKTKAWLEVIALAVPIVDDLINLIKTNLPKNKQSIEE